MVNRAICQLLEPPVVAAPQQPAQGEHRARTGHSRRLNQWVCAAAEAAYCTAGRPGRMPCRVTGASAELAEEFPHVADQEVGCFHRGEVAAAVELGPMHHVVVALGEGPDGGVAGEHRHRGRHR